MKQVTVLLPVSGHAPFIDECLNSISKQDSSVYDLLIVDDRCNLDLDAKAKMHFTESNYRIVKSRDPGIVSALNLGLNDCSTPLVARIDSDDIMLDHRLEIQAGIFKEDSNLVLLGSSIQLIDEFSNDLYIDEYPESKQEIIREITRRNPFAHPSVMFRRSAVIAVGGYRKFYELAEDYDLWLRLSQIGDVRNELEARTKYRIHAHQSTRNSPKATQLASLAAVVSYRLRLMGESELSQIYETVDDWCSDRKILGIGGEYSVNRHPLLVEELQSTIQRAKFEKSWTYYPLLAVYATIHPVQAMGLSNRRISSLYKRVKNRVNRGLETKIKRAKFEKSWTYYPLLAVYATIHPVQAVRKLLRIMNW